MNYQTFCTSAHTIPLPDRSVHLIATSPPYYGLRSYDGEQDIEWDSVEYSPMPGLPPISIPGCDLACAHDWSAVPPAKPGQVPQTKWANYCIHCGGWRGPLGLEPDLYAYIGHLILCLREWGRVLRDDGTLWVNLGDSYAGSWGNYSPHTAMPNEGWSDTRWGRPSYNDRTWRPANSRPQRGLKAKDLMMVPQRFALAAQADGWYLRSAIVWAKGISFLPSYAGSCMPESVQDRPVSGYELIFLLAKQERYFFDMEAVKEQAQNWGTRNREGQGAFTNGVMPNGQPHKGCTDLDFAERGRNLRNVWAISPRGFAGAHFACWPEKVVEPLIKMGTSARGCCPACGAPWRRVVERTAHYEKRQHRDQPNSVPPQVDSSGWRPPTIVEHGWEPTCSCPDAGEPQPCVVLDPFSGSGTTGKVAVRLGRRYIGVDLSEKYLTEVTALRMGAGVQMELSL